ncbi:hypothetical protein HMN09_00930900 [Mycena chlorophos]|uniref:DUF6534 domain-containing protein n=1 Tax=Mycena chlorophos TaxID=658473 RepID=A0A8H6SJG0_MYCCL|nr:hypothetical protein HMN09_00930900 [Mycena chlorophos]
MSAPDLTSTSGVWLVTAFVQAMLQGCGLLQAFLYFVWYPKDPWSVKATVLTMVVLQCVQISAAVTNVYNWFITGFGDFQNLNTIHRADMIQLVALFLSIFVAQAHFARCIFQLMKNNFIVPGLILLFALAALGAGLGQVIQAIGLKFYSNLGATSLSSNLQAAFALAADLLITVGLCWRLNESRTGMQSSNRIINFLVMTAINRGVFTMCFATLDIILFCVRPGTFYFMIGFLVSDKLYMNSLLAILNTRQYAMDLRGTSEISGGGSRSLPPMSFAPNRSNAAGPGPGAGLSRKPNSPGANNFAMSVTSPTATTVSISETYRGPDELGFGDYERKIRSLA